MTQDAANLPTPPGSPQWGIYLNNVPVVLADNVLGVSYKKDYTLSDFPVEQGAFQTYDKVEVPFDARVTFSAGGSQQNRTAFLNSLSAIVGTLSLYSVNIPEGPILSCNVTHYDWDRTEDNGGAGIIVAEVYLLQVRVTATAAFSQTGSAITNAQQPSGQSPVGGGNVTLQAPPANVSQAIMNAELGSGG